MIIHQHHEAGVLYPSVVYSLHKSLCHAVCVQPGCLMLRAGGTYQTMICIIVTMSAITAEGPVSGASVYS
jgi:hypothetical protein